MLELACRLNTESNFGFLPSLCPIRVAVPGRQTSQVSEIGGVSDLAISPPVVRPNRPLLWRSWSVKESSNDRIRLRAFLRTLFCRLEELLHCGGGHPLLYPLTGRVVSCVMFKAGGLIYAKPLSSPRRRNQGGLSQHGYWDKMTPTRSRLWIFRARRGCHDGCRVCQLSHGG